MFELSCMYIKILAHNPPLVTPVRIWYRLPYFLDFKFRIFQAACRRQVNAQLKSPDPISLFHLFFFVFFFPQLFVVILPFIHKLCSYLENIFMVPFYLFLLDCFKWRDSLTFHLESNVIFGSHVFTLTASFSAFHSQQFLYLVQPKQIPL